jgi:uroporphyrin-III C-methyltransferase
VIGKVFLVGAGPGDPGLITVSGLRCIRAADVIVYDRLVDPALLEEAPRHADRIFAGKETGNHALAQDAINELLVMNALLGKQVVRLKGGDPFVFGRGGEEAVFLAHRGIPFEVIPGVSSVFAVPAYAGIPLTYRGLAESFTVVTAHSCGESGRTDFAGLFRDTGTLVVLMGAARLGEIVLTLLSGGVDPGTPVAVIERGASAVQRTIVSTLAAVRHDAADVASPAVIVVGQVVTLNQTIRWFPEQVLNRRTN